MVVSTFSSEAELGKTPAADLQGERAAPTGSFLFLQSPFIMGWLLVDVQESGLAQRLF